MGHINPTFPIDGYEKPISTVVWADDEHTLITAPLIEKLIEDGEERVASDVTTVVGSATKDYLITIPSGCSTHMGIRAGVGGAFVYRIYDSPNATGGVTVSGYNRTRGELDTDPCTIITSSPDVTDVGIRIFWRIIPGGTPLDTLGAAMQYRYGWLLKGGNKYLIRLTNLTANNRWVSIQFDWHGHQE